MPRKKKRLEPGVRRPQGDRKKVEESQRIVDQPDVDEPRSPTSTTDVTPDLVERARGLPGVEPGQSFTAPSNRSNEPVTAGMRGGPGSGPEAFVPFQPPARDMRVEEAVSMIPALPYLELAASRSGSSPALRAYVRKTRALLPPGAVRQYVQSRPPVSDE